MHRRLVRALVAAALVVVGVGLGCGPAGAQTAALNLSPSSVPAGGRVTVTGTCDPDSSGYVLTDAFLGHGEFAGVPAVAFTTDAAGNFAFTVRIGNSIVPGTYSVGARCGGANIGLSRTLRVTPARLVDTGADVATAVLPGLLLVLAGLGCVIAARRRAVAR